jgi:cytochrome c2
MANQGRTRRGVVTAVALGWTIVCAAAPAAAQDPPTSPYGNPTAGERLFSERGCVRCHSIWGNGGNLGPDLGQVGLGRSLLQLAGMFWNHTPRMIETVRSRGYEWSTFTEADLADVISYVYYVKLFDPPGDPTLGARWFREKRCQECHQVGGRGGRVGPSLDVYAQYLTPIPLAAGMWNHGRMMRDKQSGAGIPVPHFYGAEISDIQAYIRSAAHTREHHVVLLAPPDPAHGERLFRTKGCTACHGPSGRGTKLAPDLRTAIQQLRASEIAGELWNHSSDMSEAIRKQGVTFPEFKPSELADVIAYLYYLRFLETEGNATVGKRLFADKGCTRCHALDGSKSVGPDLATSTVVASPMALATAMWNHAPSMYQHTRQAGIPWPLFQGDEMRDLAAYLRSLGSHPTAGARLPPPAPSPPPASPRRAPAPGSPQA